MSEGTHFVVRASRIATSVVIRYWSYDDMTMNIVLLLFVSNLEHYGK